MHSLKYIIYFVVEDYYYSSSTNHRLYMDLNLDVPTGHWK